LLNCGAKVLLFSELTKLLPYFFSKKVVFYRKRASESREYGFLQAKKAV